MYSWVGADFMVSFCSGAKLMVLVVVFAGAGWPAPPAALSFWITVSAFVGTAVSDTLLKHMVLVGADVG
jgi:hypothetical protein